MNMVLRYIVVYLKLCFAPGLAVLATPRGSTACQLGDRFLFRTAPQRGYIAFSPS